MATALEKKWPLYLSTKNTILKKYDGRYAIYFLISYLFICFHHTLLYWSLFNYILLLVKDSRTYFKKFTRQAGNQSTRLLVYGEWMCTFFFEKKFFIWYLSFIFNIMDLEGMSIDSLMIWWHMHSRVKEVMYGHARTMMEMSRVIS